MPDNGDYFRKRVRAALGFGIFFIWALSVLYAVYTGLAEDATTDQVVTILALLSLVTIPMMTVIGWFFNKANED